jgi:hypothetical protein
LTYTHDSWISIDVPPSEIGAAIVVGLGGSQALSVYMRGAIQRSEWTKTVGDSADALQDLAGITATILKQHAVDKQGGPPDTQIED